MLSLPAKPQQPQIMVLIALSCYWAAACMRKYNVVFETDNSYFLFHTVGSLGLTAILLFGGLIPALLNTESSRKIVQSLPFVFVFFATLLNALSAQQPFDALEVQLFARFCFTIGIGAILLQAGAYLTRFSAKQASQIIVYSFFIGTVIALVAQGFSTHIVSAFGCLCAFVGAAAVAGVSFDKAVQPPIQDVSRSLAAPSRIPRGFWPLSVGLLLYSIVFGISICLVFLVQQESSLSVPFGIFLVIPALIMVLLVMTRGPKLNYQFFQWLLFIPAAVGLIALTAAGPDLAYISGALQTVTFTCYDISNLLILVFLAHGCNWIMAVRVFAWGRAVNSLGLAIGGLAFIPLTGIYPATNNLVLQTIVIVSVVILVIGVAFLGKADVRKPAATSEKDSKGRWTTVCEQTADEFNLSPRERDVLFLLAKGRSMDIIAQKLHVSVSTIKTHANRIYRKSNVHTQQELMDLIEERVTKQVPPHVKQ